MQYTTTDIVLATYLKCSGYNVSKLTIDNNKGSFTFDHIDQAVLDNFILGNGKVEPVHFNDTLKQLVTSVRRTIGS